MQDDLMKRLQDSLMGLNSVQDVQVPFRPEEEEIPEAQPQELQQPMAPVTQVEPEQPQQEPSPAIQPPPQVTPERSIDDIRSQILSADEGYDAKLQDAKDSDFKRNALAQALKVLGTASMGQFQKAAGQNIGLKPIEMDEIKTETSALEKSRQQNLDKLMQEYKMLQGEQELAGKKEDRELDREIKRQQLELQKTKAEAPKDNTFSKKKQEVFGKSAVEYFTKDRDQLVNNVNKIDNALTYLTDPKTKDSISGPIRGLAPDAVRSFTNPEAIVVKESIQSAIQETLRPTLGAQFTEKEGERIMNLAYNDRLPPEENARRAKQLKQMVENKVRFSDALYQYIEDNGSDKGFPYEQYGMQSTMSEPLTDKTVTIGDRVFSVGQTVKVKGKQYKIKNAKGELEEIK